VNGTISPPNYPNASPRPFKCTYRILAKPSQAIRIRFDKIALGIEYGICFYQREKQLNTQQEDYIEVWD
jgi:hypothetical protein